jgi:hypothetical protein
MTLWSDTFIISYDDLYNRPLRERIVFSGGLCQSALSAFEDFFEDKETADEEVMRTVDRVSWLFEPKRDRKTAKRRHCQTANFGGN